MEVLQKVVDFCMRHQIILGYSTVSLMTALSEQIFSSAAFQCPCNSNNMLYGASFLVAPAFVLFLLSFMVNPRTWRLLTGMCPPDKHHEHKSRRICARFWQLWVPMIAKASVAPFTWIAVALLGANYYECAASGSSLMEYYYCKGNGSDCQNQLLKVPCDEELSANFTTERLSLHAQSQLLGWLLIATIMAVALFSTCVNRCRAPVTYLHHRFCEIYSKIEEELFQIKAKEHATKLAERNTSRFFDNKDPGQFHTPSHEDWKEISTIHTYNSQDQYYSMLHKYVSTNRGNSTKFEDESQPLTVLASPDEAPASVSAL